MAEQGQHPIDRDTALEVYKNYSSVLMWHIDKVWSGIKFYTVGVSSLIVATIAICSSVIVNTDGGEVPTFFLVTAILPAMCMAITVLSMKNLRREYERYLGNIATYKKLSEAIGITGEGTFQCLPEDRYLLEERHLKSTSASTKEFVSRGMQRPGTLLSGLIVLHWIYIVSALILLIVIFGVVGVQHYAH